MNTLGIVASDRRNVSRTKRAPNPTPSRIARVLLQTLVACGALAACGGGGGGTPVGGGNGVTVALTPADANLGPGELIQFVVQVQGTNDARVRFEVSAGPGGVTADGKYTAPKTVQAAGETASVRAVSLADERAVATATVHLSPAAGNAGLEALGAKIGSVGATSLSDTQRTNSLQCVEAAVLGARLTNQNQPVRFGTFRMQNGQPSYEATPTDRLIVIPPSGISATFTIATMTGNFTNAAASFFDNDHDLDINMTVAGVVQAQATSHRRARETLRTMIGILVVDANEFNANVTQSESIYFESGTGIEFKSRNVLRGTLQGQGIRVQVNDEFDFHYIYVTHAVATRMQTLASTWEVNGTGYELRDGKLNTVFQDGVATELGFWKAEGSVLKNGVVIGTLQPRTENRFYIVDFVRGTERGEFFRIFMGV